MHCRSSFASDWNFSQYSFDDDDGGVVVVVVVVVDDDDDGEQCVVLFERQMVTHVISRWT